MIPAFPAAELEALCKVLGDTKEGFSNTEIERLFHDCNLKYFGPATKWKRLTDSLSNQQSKDHCGNCIGDFLQKAMAPARYISNQDLFETRRQKLNLVLSLLGYAITKEGKLSSAPKANTIDEAYQRMSNLRDKLQKRDVHSEVFRYCTAELIADNYFHAVFESCKGIFDRLRTVTGLSGDGADIIQTAFSEKNPLVAINRLQTDSEWSEHKGFANLLKGVFGMIRNPLAHNPKLNWQMTEQDALDTFSLLSMIHRRMDKMVVIPARSIDR